MAVDPQMMAQLMASLGGGGQQQQPPDQGGGDWLTAAINAVHSGMVEEKDPKQVSLLGAILNQLTTFQANAAAAPPAQRG